MDPFLCDARRTPLYISKAFGGDLRNLTGSVKTRLDLLRDEIVCQNCVMLGVMLAGCERDDQANDIEQRCSFLVSHPSPAGIATNDCGNESFIGLYLQWQSEIIMTGQQ